MKLLLILFSIFSFNIFAQDSLQKMSFTQFSAKVYLVPKEKNNFIAQKDTKVNFTLTMTNGGEEEYALMEKQFLTGFYMINAREVPMPLKIEAISQLKIISLKLKTYANRIAQLEKTNQAAGDKYAEKMSIPKITTKLQLLKYLKTQIEQLTQLKKSAEAFDKNRTVKPGATLIFSGSGFIPQDTKKKVFGEAYFTFKIFNSDGKPINIPVTAIFY